MKDLGVTEQEARARAERARQDEEETPREQALEWCRLLVGRYAGADELATLQVVDAGPCMDEHTGHPVEVRYQVGRFAVCRNHAVMRIRARLNVEATDGWGYVPDERRPDDLEQWAQAVAAIWSERAVRASLRVWNVDDDGVVETLDVYADARAIIAARQKAEELLLQQLDTLDEQRCDHCKTRGTVYLTGDQALCKQCTIAARELVAA